MDPYHLLLRIEELEKEVESLSDFRDFANQLRKEPIVTEEVQTRIEKLTGKREFVLDITEGAFTADIKYYINGELHKDMGTKVLNKRDTLNLQLDLHQE